MDFCKAFNDKTKSQQGMVLPVIIDVYADRSFDFVIKSPPASFLIKQEAKLKKGSGEPNKNKVASLTMDQLKKIAEIKEADLSANDIDAATKIIAGTARSMGVKTPYFE